MNFLAHFIFATRFQSPILPLPAYAVGTALPDLLPLAAASVRFRLAQVNHSIVTSLEDQALRAGVRSHLAADAAFHRTQVFADAQTEAGALLDGAGFMGIRVRRFFLAHILVELALDAALLRTNPAVGEEFYAAFEAADREDVTRWAEIALTRLLPNLPHVLTRFASSRYLLHYQTDEGVATGLSRLCARARQDTFDGENHARLARIVGEMVQRVSPQWQKFISETAYLSTTLK